MVYLSVIKSSFFEWKFTFSKIYILYIPIQIRYLIFSVLFYYKSDMIFANILIFLKFHATTI